MTCGFPVLIAATTLGRRLADDADARDGRLGVREDDVLRLLDVDARLAQALERMREHAWTVLVAHHQHVRGRRLPAQVHHVRHAPGAHVGLDDPHRLVRDRLLRLLGRGADVVRAVDAGQPDERVREFAGRHGRLLAVDIDGHAEALLPHRRLQGLVVHDLGAGGVHEAGARLHAIEDGGPDQPACPVVQREVHAQDVAVRRDGLGRLVHRHRRFLRVRRRRAEPHQLREVGGQAVAADLDADLAPDGEVHAERLRPARHLLADAAEAEDAERAAVQALRLRELLLVPPPRPQLGHVVGDAPVEGQDEPEREFRHRHGVLAGAIGDVDAAARGALDVDGVVARPGAHDQRQLSGFQDRVADLGGPDHEDVGLRARQRVRQGRVLELGLVRHAQPQGPERVQALLLELVGNQHVHDQAA